MTDINPTVPITKSTIYKIIYQLKESVRLDKNYDPTICCLEEIHYKYKTNRLKQKEWKKTHHKTLIIKR